jgi:deoxyribodipyrimidine photo-lyase
MAEQLARGGGGRVILRAGETGAELARLAQEVGAAAVYANRSEGERAAAVERVVAERLAAIGVRLVLHDDLGVLPPDAALTNNNTPYMVYTPYARRWRELLLATPPKERTVRGEALRVGADLSADLDSLDAERTLAAAGYDLAPWRAVPGDLLGGRTAHLRALDAFLQARVARYQTGRDLPAQPGTSRLSAALRWGTISARECWRLARIYAAEHPEASAGVETWIGELAWADFFRAVLHHFPQSEHAAFRASYAGIVWEGDPAHLDIWAAGRTGYPIVDAGMRQLLAEGWMHNRVRMIVASFLVKDLLLDWRLGERHFMRHLVDGAVSANVGNWQWAASTGTDAQPYFRIFNPTSQSAKFDPTGDYIRRYVPELARLPNTAIHIPWKLAPAEQRRLGCVVGQDYPAPIVDHAAQRPRALAMFRRLAPDRDAPDAADDLS